MGHPSLTVVISLLFRVELHYPVPRVSKTWAPFSKLCHLSFNQKTWRGKLETDFYWRQRRRRRKLLCMWGKVANGESAEQEHRVFRGSSLPLPQCRDKWSADATGFGLVCRSSPNPFYIEQGDWHRTQAASFLSPVDGSHSRVCPSPHWGSGKI
jgi:hypothetical protein